MRAANGGGAAGGGEQSRPVNGFGSEEPCSTHGRIGGGWAGQGGGDDGGEGGGEGGGGEGGGGDGGGEGGGEGGDEAREGRATWGSTSPVGTVVALSGPPQQSSVPLASRPQVWEAPALMSTNVRPLGTVLWPWPLEPQQCGVPLGSRAHVWKAPALMTAKAKPVGGVSWPAFQSIPSSSSIPLGVPQQ